MVKISISRRVRDTVIVITAMAALLVVALVTDSNPVQAVPASSVPTVQVQPPGSGYWNKFNYSSVDPMNHHIKFGGHWSTDFYMAPNMTVRTRAYPASQVGAVKYYVSSVTSTCASGYNAGKTVKVKFYYNGVYAGFAAYAHLDRVAVTAGNWYPHAQILGYTKQWAPAGTCWQVTNAGGTHVHFELYTEGDNHKACWYARRAGSWVDYWGVIGRIGANTPTTKRSCP